MFLYKELSIHHNKELEELRKLYCNLEKFINNCSSEIHLPGDISFNTKVGDITDGIKWSWAMNKKSMKYFDNYLKSVNFYNTMKSICENSFHIRGASYIVLDKLEVTDTDFHLDVIDMHRIFIQNTEILTVIFPLFTLEEGIGHLEYKDINGEVNLYKYRDNKLLVWDACKFEHRTQPFISEKPYKRVLVSINLSTDNAMAKTVLDSSISSQGNKINLN